MVLIDQNKAPARWHGLPYR